MINGGFVLYQFYRAFSRYECLGMGPKKSARENRRRVRVAQSSGAMRSISAIIVAIRKTNRTYAYNSRERSGPRTDLLMAILTFLEERITTFSLALVHIVSLSVLVAVGIMNNEKIIIKKIVITNILNVYGLTFGIYIISDTFKLKVIYYLTEHRLSALIIYPILLN